MTDSVFSITVGQSFTATLEFLDAAGDVATAPVGIPVWASSDPLLTAVAAADGLSALCTSVGLAGLSTITVTDNALTGTLAVTIAAGPAASLTIVPGPAA